MSAEQEVIEGHAEEVSTELTIAPAAAPATLFRTDDPVQVLARATEVADALKDVIVKRKLYKNISGNSHVLVEGWLTLGSMLGVTAVCEWTRPIENGWEARVVAQTLDGRTIAAAESMCVSSEGKPWDKAKDHARRSMAQTRATSKALASVLRFVVTLAGYEGTPAEEAEDVPRSRASAAPQAEAGPALSEDRAKEIVEALRVVGLPYGRIKLLLGSVGADAPKINRADSLLKAIRAMSPEQAERFEALLSEEADRAAA